MKDDELATAIRDALTRATIAIEQVDLVIEGNDVLAYGYTADPDVTYIATFPLPPLGWRRA